LKIKPSNWQEFQHYNKRRPPWIKLHHKLLDSYDFHSLPAGSRALAPMLWLIASEHMDGVIDADPSKLSFRLRTSASEIEEALSPLIGKGFFDVVQFDSVVLAECKQSATPETETETEKTRAASASPVWGHGLSLLTQTMPEREARRFLGRLCGEWEETDVAAALLAADGKLDPRAYARKILSTTPKKLKPPPGSEAVLAQLRAQHGDSVTLARDGKSFWHPQLQTRWTLDGEKLASL
jgi:hypothetical protein